MLHGIQGIPADLEASLGSVECSTAYKASLRDAENSQLNICWVPVSGLNEAQAEKGVSWHDRT